MKYKLKPMIFDGELINILFIYNMTSWTLWYNPKNHYIPPGFDSEGFRKDRKLFLGPTISDKIMEEVKALVVKELL